MRRHYHVNHAWRPLNVLRGSALSETLLLMLVLIPLIAAIASVGKFTGLRQQSLMAARYSAWERTVGSLPDDTASAVKTWFSRPDGADDGLQQSRPALRGPGLQQPTVAHGTTRARLRSRFAGVVVDAVNVRNGVASAAGESRFSLASIVRSVVPVTAGSPVGSPASAVAPPAAPAGAHQTGLVTAEIDVDIADHPWLGDWLPACVGSAPANACLHESSTVYLDDWSAPDDATAIERIRELLPSTALQPLGVSLSKVGRLPGFSELQPLGTAFGHVDMSVLPGNRPVGGGPSGGLNPDAAVSAVQWSIDREAGQSDRPQRPVGAAP